MCSICSERSRRRLRLRAIGSRPFTCTLAYWAQQCTHDACVRAGRAGREG
jgi:hypothetical protein